MLAELMNLFQPRHRVLAILLVCSVALLCLTATRGRAADYGRISGIVTDAQGSPLMGASVSIIGPLLTGLQPVESAVARVITDAHGRFAVERLVPGWYSLQVTSAMRLPILRSRVRVEAGQTLQENLVLSDILAPLRLKVPAGSVSSWGDDWKWVLRTSSATRPVLRFREASKTTTRSRMAKAPLPASQGLVGMIPGLARRSGMGGDPGIDSVLAYLRPLSEDADLLVAGSMGASGLQASSLATVFRRDLLKGDPQELALIMHQLSFADGLPLASAEGRDSLSHAQALVVSYAQTRRILDSVVLAAGMEIDYLNATQDVLSIRPSMKLEYRASPSNVFAARYGALRVDGDGSLLERVGILAAFPRVTLRGYRPQLERLNHAELSFSHTLRRNSRLELAAYRDYFENAAVWGLGGGDVLGGLTGNFLPNPAANGVTLHAGNYTSSGLRAAYTQSVNSYMQMAVLYALGDALSVAPSYAPGEGPIGNLRSFVHPRRTQIVAGKVTTRLPRCRTQITTSYEWLPSGRVADVDPYGQANLQLQPFLGVQIRQPLPSLAFLPARIEALADFRNLLAQGYVPVSRSGEETLQLTPAYRSFQGGFSVLF
jgi:hypothetical protein